MKYTSFDRDSLKTADHMTIDRRIYFVIENEKTGLLGLAAMPLSELKKQREASAAAEQELFSRLKDLAAVWEKQAGKTLAFDKTMEYVRTLPAEHTSNEWKQPGGCEHIRSNAVYKMSYSIFEETRHDSAAEKHLWSLRWSIYTNAPGVYGQIKIAGQDRKVFKSREELDKYLDGRIKAYRHLFTEIYPAVPKECADRFKVNGLLLPGYTIEGEEIRQSVRLL